MNQNIITKIVAVISIVLITSYLIWLSKDKVEPKSVVQLNKAEAIVTKHDVLKTTPLTAVKKELSSAFLTVGSSAILISKVYAAELNYPPYSQPLNVADFDRLNPNYFNPQTMLIDGDGTKISASLSKYRYSYPEPIVASINGDNIESASIELIDPQTKKILLSQSFQGQEGLWQINIAGEQDFPEELQAKVVARVDGKTVPIVLALKYYDPVAVLESLYPARVDNSDMVIEAKIVTKKAGLYKVRANLFDADNQPIAQLVAKERLKVGDQKMSLKAHQSVLQGRKSPFYLTTFMVELMSPSPGVRKKFGESVIKKFVINDFALSSLDITPYEASTEEKQRLALLQQIAGGK